MNLKISKLIYSLSKNSRRRTKDLAKDLGSSQQSCSYLINQYKKKNYIKDYLTIADPVRFGFMNIVVGFDFLNLQYQKKSEIIQYFLSKVDFIINIEENQLGVDLLVEYSVLNMSAFNKSHSEIIKKFQGDIRARFIYPVIVKHRFNKNYLVRKGDYSDTIICGDREPVELTINEKAIVSTLVENPDISMTGIASKTGISQKTVSKIKRKLESQGIIKGYSCVLNTSKFDIKRYHVLFNFSHEGVGFINSFVNYARMHKNIISLVKLLGHYQVMITVEELKSSDIIKQIRKNFPTDDYLMIESEKVIKEKACHFNF
ncbi:MAG: winged helix-turn-helix transcriptional regulator [Nanobdellota archaeon]